MGWGSRGLGLIISKSVASGERQNVVLVKMTVGPEALQQGVLFKKNHTGLWWLSGKESACQCRRHGFDP